MTLKYIYLRLQYFHLMVQSKIIRITTGIAKKHLWFRRLYGWYFKRFEFNEMHEYGSCVRVKTIDWYSDEKIAKKFAWLTKMLIPEHLQNKIEYVRSKNGIILFDTIGWIYRGTG